MITPHTAARTNTTRTYMKHLILIFIITIIGGTNAFGSHSSNPYINITFINPPIDQVERDNLDISDDYMHFTENIGEVSKEDKPIIFADIRILAVDPSISDRISNLHIPHVIWGWGEDHLNKWEYTIPDSCCGDDYDRKIVWKSEGNPELVEASMNFKFGEVSRDENTVHKQYSLDNGTIISLSDLNLTEDDLNSTNISIHVSYIPDNPIDIPFTTEELDTDPDEDNGRVPDMEISLHGKIEFPYVKTVYYKTEHWENGSCSCDSKEDEEHLIITKVKSDSKSYHVDNHNVTFFLKTPITHEITNINPYVEYILFTNRYPQKFVFYINGVPFSIYYIYNYKEDMDKFGFFKIIKTSSYSDSFLTPNSGYSDKDILNFMDLHIKGKTYYKQKRYHYIEPYQLENTSEAYGILYDIKTYYNQSILGMDNFNLVFYDLFNDPYISKNDVIYTRIPLKCHYSINQSVIHFWLTDYNDELIPNYPLMININNKNQMSSTGAGGEGISIPRLKGRIIVNAPSNDYYRGCSREIITTSVSNDAIRVCMPIIVVVVIIFAVTYKFTSKILPFNWR